MKRLVVGCWLLVVGAWAAVAAPSVEITKVKLADARDGTVEYAYTVDGDFEGWIWDLVVKVSSGDGEASAEVTNKVVKTGTVTTNVNVKALLGKAYPGVSLFAKLEKNVGDVQLWAGGPYFAQCNVGATKPVESGYYFWWGDTVGYKRNSSNNGWVSADGKGTTIEFSSSDTTAKQTSDHETTGLADNGWIDKSGNLVATDDAATNRDAARAHLGYPWRMMTKDEIDALIKNCKVKWMTLNGVSGCLVTGEGDFSSKSIFLPAAGFGGSNYLGDDGSRGYYWSSSPYSVDPLDAWRLDFNADRFNRNINSRYYGHPVRPVR